jgi:hypothetical protein
VGEDGEEDDYDGDMEEETLPSKIIPPTPWTVKGEEDRAEDDHDGLEEEQAARLKITPPAPPAVKRGNNIPEASSEKHPVSSPLISGIIEEGGYLLGNLTVLCLLIYD